MIIELRKYLLSGCESTDLAMSESFSTSPQAAKVGCLGHRVGGMAIASVAGLIDVVIMM